MKNKLFEALSEDNGRLSSIRLLMFMVVISLIIDWQHAIWTTGIWNVKLDTLGFVATILGLKVYQKKVENED